MPAQRLHLLFDADDTLWENALFFEAALAEFKTTMMRAGVSEERSQVIFEELEGRGFRRRWYGGRRLRINMKAAARLLVGPQLAEELDRELQRIGQSVAGHEIRILDRVPETLEVLARDHQLILVTMGESSEQRAKIERSGLDHHFEAIHILHDKTRAAYEGIIRRHRLDPRSGWMIGNSLAKDIRPARAAGLNTVHFANGQDFSFGLETKLVRADRIIRSFDDLTRLFEVRP